MAKQGYVKMYRRITESPVWADSDKLKLWVLCMMNASHDGYKQIIGNQTIEITKGQFITGRNALSEEYNKNVKKAKKIDGLTLFRWLSIFEELEMLNIKKTNKYTIVTVLNWDKYQTAEQQMNNNRTSNEHQVNINRTTDEQQLNTNKNVKECIRMIKNDKEKKIIPTKHRHGEYKNVLLTDTEIEKLVTDYPNHQELIKFLDEYIEMKGYKAKSHYLAIKKWVVDAVGEKTKKKEVLPF